MSSRYRMFDLQLYSGVASLLLRLKYLRKFSPVTISLVLSDGATLLVGLLCTVASNVRMIVHLFVMHQERAYSIWVIHLRWAPCQCIRQPHVQFIEIKSTAGTIDPICFHQSIRSLLIVCPDRVS